MNAEDNQRAIALLQEDLRQAHALIVQLMNHGYRLRDLRTLHVVEGIARQVMRHYKWIAERVVKLGGEPTLERAPVAVAADTPVRWLEADVAASEATCNRYRRNREWAANRDARLFSLYDRLLADETAHGASLTRLLAAWHGREPGSAPAMALDAGDADTDRIRGFLDFAIGHEYEVILQYLHHGFLLPDAGVSREMEEIAIEEMRHLGWLTETLVEKGGCPRWEAGRLERDADPIRMLKLDQARELEVEADYQEMTAAMADPAVKQLFDRIGDHERYHAGVIGEMIAKLEDAESQRCPVTGRAATVGSLLGTGPV